MYKLYPLIAPAGVLTFGIKSHVKVIDVLVERAVTLDSPVTATG